MSTLAWPLLLLAFGIILFIAEAFVPSGGLIGLLALGCVGVSVWQAFRVSTDLGLKFLFGAFLLLPLVISVGLYLWPKTPMAKRVFLQPPQPEDIEDAHTGSRLDHLIGQFGRSLTPLRPSGLVDFDGRRLDALSEDGLIPAGSLVRAVRVRSGQLIVRFTTDSIPEAAGSISDDQLT